MTPKLAQPYNINVIGTSGSGKSTFSQQLAEKLDVRYVEMDALFWKADWQTATDEELFGALTAVMETDGWVIDGNYSRTTALKWRKATTVIWLDYSFPRTICQVVTRTVNRAWDGQELWAGTGNVETFRKAFFDKKSIIWWAISTYFRNRKRNQKLISDPDYQHIQFLRFRHPKEAQRFLDRVSKNYN